MGKIEGLTEQLAEARRELKAWKHRAIAAEAELARREEALRPEPAERRRCEAFKRSPLAGGPLATCALSSGHEGMHRSAEGSYFRAS